MATGAVDTGAARSYLDLVLEGIALRRQIAILKRCGTRRAYLQLRDRLFWMLLSRLWLRWRTSLMIVQPETVLRWRRQGWSVLWRSGGDGGGVDVRESRTSCAY